jgi:FMN phosphatase YigB (HAD superfamily)
LRQDAWDDRDVEAAMSWLILFDADNTLWDADSVYREAQLQLLSILSRAGILQDPERDFRALRDVDMELARYFGIFEYDIEYLARAIALRSLTGAEGEELIRAVSAPRDSEAASLRPFWHAIKEAADAYVEGLHRTPLLFPDTVSVLRRIHEARGCGEPLVTAVLTEGRRDRIQRILDAHHVHVGELFDEIVIVHRKNKGEFEEARAVMERALPAAARSGHAMSVMVGDTLTRDVKFANQAGYLTVYKPSPFKGIEQPAAEDEVPDYTITRLIELLPILDDLGLRLDTSALPDADRISTP